MKFEREADYNEYQAEILAKIKRYKELQGESTYLESGSGMGEETEMEIKDLEEYFDDNSDINLRTLDLNNYLNTHPE